MFFYLILVFILFQKMSFSNRFKLNKTINVRSQPIINNNFKYNKLDQQAYVLPLRNQLKKTNTVNNPVQITKSVLTKPNITSSANLFVNQSLESSNKLDDLLKRCREIGGASGSSSSNTNSESKTVIRPINEIRITKFKIIKTSKTESNKDVILTKTKRITYETNRLLAARRKKYLQTQLRLKNSVKPKIFYFSVINKRPGIYKQVNNITKASSESNSTKNLYKINKRFKLVNSNSQTISLKKNNFIVKKYRILTATKLINKQNNLIKKASIAPVSSTSSNNNKTLSSFKLNNKNKQYCLFYNRFGRCSRGDSCKLIHDSKRIALCPRLVLFFLFYRKSF
jgi:hypothetical protein